MGAAYRGSAILMDRSSSTVISVRWNIFTTESDLTVLRRRPAAIAQHIPMQPLAADKRRAHSTAMLAEPIDDGIARARTQGGARRCRPYRASEERR